jgi:RimJ/RimL family protein N-acetyltransferase
VLVESKVIKLKNGLDLVLRSPQPGEAEAMLVHLKIAYEESYRNLNGPANSIDHITVDKETEILSNFASAKNRFLIAAFLGGRIVAGLGLHSLGEGFTSQSASLGMSVQAAYQGLGLGTEMIRYALSEAKRIGLHRVELHVRTFNESGIALYEKTGFRKIGTAREIALIDGKYEDEFIYEIVL